MSNPPTVTVPFVGGIKPVIIRMVVDLPAPFGPRKPSTSPRATEKEIPSTARFRPNVLVRFSTLIMYDNRSIQRATPENCHNESKSGRRRPLFEIIEGRGNKMFKKR